MNDNDMANMIKKAQEMINNNQVPDEIKNIVAHMQNNNLSNSNNASYNNHNYNNSTNNSNNTINRSFNNNFKDVNNSISKQDYNKYSSTYSQRNRQVNNHANNANNKDCSSNSNNTSNINFDMNKLGDLFKNFQSNNSKTNSESQGNSSQIDMETLLKLQNVMSKMKSFNSDDDMSQLLTSLKPYLRNEKKEKVDEYIKLIKMGKMTQAFDLFGGDKN